ncbi:quinone oxidoreductase [Amycolatopsis echigonensis]
MRVVTASQYGPPEVLHCEDRPTPEPKPDEVIVSVEAAGINLMDTYLRRGYHPSFKPPLALGVDGAGSVTAVGEQATAKVGDRVAWELVPGSYAEMVAVPCERLVTVPDSVSFESAAGGLMQAMTAQYLCCVAVDISKDAVVLVHSAGSGVGRMLTQLATHLGARVIATVSRAHKASSAQDAGAWQVLVRDEIDDLAGAIQQLVNGKGVDLVFDGTGKTLFETSLSVLRVGGTFVTYGYAGGHIPPVSLWEQPHGVRLLPIKANGPELTAGQWRERAHQVMQWIKDGTLDVLIDRSYSLEDAALAHRDLESQETVGKLLLIP